MNDNTFLYPKFKKKLDLLNQSCIEKGILFSITDGFRTKNEQNHLYSKGRTSSGFIATDKQYPDNYHCWGLAVSISSSDIGHVYDMCDELNLCYAGKEIYDPIMTLKELRVIYGNYYDFIWKYNSNIKKIIVDSVDIESAGHNTEVIRTIQYACNVDGFKTNRKSVLKITGILDTDTMEALSHVDIKSNKKYMIIKPIQSLLKSEFPNTNINSIYDDITKNNIVKFQAINGLSIDGIITGDLIVLILAKL